MASRTDFLFSLLAISLSRSQKKGVTSNDPIGRIFWAGWPTPFCAGYFWGGSSAGKASSAVINPDLIARAMAWAWLRAPSFS